VFRSGRVVNPQSTNEPISNPPGAGGPKRTWAAPEEGQLKSCRSGAQVVDLQQPAPDSCPPNQSPLEGIADILDKLSISACLQLTRRLHYTTSSLPTADACQPAILKTIILYLAAHGGAAE
jgi:hypothetical protein